MKYIITSALLACSLVVGAVIKDVDNSGCRDGVWTADLTAARSYAKSNKRPYIIVWGNNAGGCGLCNAAATATWNKPEFKSWAAENKIALVMADMISGAPAAKTAQSLYLSGQVSGIALPVFFAIDGLDGKSRLGFDQYHASRVCIGEGPTAGGTYGVSLEALPVTKPMDLIRWYINKKDDLPTKQAAKNNNYPVGPREITPNSESTKAEKVTVHGLYGDWEVNDISTYNYVAGGSGKVICISEDKVDWYTFNNEKANTAYVIKTPTLTDKNKEGFLGVYMSESDATAAAKSFDKAKSKAGANWFSMTDLKKGKAFTVPKAGPVWLLFTRRDANEKENITVKYTFTLQVGTLETDQYAFKTAATEIDEATTNATVNIALTRTLAAAASSVAVTYGADDDTAVAGVDYKVGASTVSFAGTDKTATLPVTILKSTQGLWTGDRWFTVSIKEDGVEGGITSHKVTIKETDEKPVVSFAASQTVEFDSPKAEESKTFSVAVPAFGWTSLPRPKVKTVVGTAIEGTDYIGLVDAEVSESGTVSVTLKAAGTWRPDRTFKLVLEGDEKGYYDLGEPKELEITIKADKSDANESISSIEDPIVAGGTFDFKDRNLSHTNTSDALFFQVKAGTPYVLTAKDVTIKPASTAIDVTVSTNDVPAAKFQLADLAVFEKMPLLTFAEDGVIKVEVSRNANTEVLAEYSLGLAEWQVGTVAFEKATVTNEQSEASWRYNLKRTGNTQLPATTFVTLKCDTTVDGKDVSAFTKRPVMFKTGSATAEIVVTNLATSAVWTDDRSFTLSVEAVDDDDKMSVGVPSNAVVTIKARPYQPPKFALTVDKTAITDEKGSCVNLLVARTENTNETSTVTLTRAIIGATSASGFTDTLPSSLTFLPGEDSTNLTCTVKAGKAGVWTGDWSFTVALGATGNVQIDPAKAQVTVAVKDCDKEKDARDAYDDTEEGTVGHGLAISGDAGLLADGRLNGSDTNDWIRFTGVQNGKTYLFQITDTNLVNVGAAGISVRVVQGSTDETYTFANLAAQELRFESASTEDILVCISRADTSTSAKPVSVAYALTYHEQSAVVFFTKSTATVNEAMTFVALDVVCSTMSPLASDVKVKVVPRTIDGDTATAPEDYEGQPLELTWAAGSKGGTNTIAIILTNYDNDYEGDETFHVMLEDVVGAELGNYENVKVTIKEINDPPLKVTFNANGGEVDEAQREVMKDNAVGTLPEAERKGYTFNGWYTKTSGGTKIKKSTKVTKNVTYYAQWTAIKYKIKFNSNGGTGTMGTLSATYGKNVTLTANAFKRANNSFKGWAKKKSATAADYANKEKVKNLTATDGETVTLYAVWKPYTYTVKFNKNGGTGTVVTQTVNCGEKTALDKNTYTREGFKFAGWATKKGGTVVYKNKAKVKDLVKKGNTITLYAVWYPEDWAVGTFTGAGEIAGKAATVTLTVGSTGKISGKFVRKSDKKAFTFKADAFTEFQEGALCVATTIAYGSKKCALAIAVSQDGEARLLVTYNGKDYGEATLALK